MVEDVARPPPLSVARAVILNVPTLVGVQETWNGLLVADPIVVPFTKNSTESIPPSISVAFAVTVVGTFIVIEVDAIGSLMATCGGRFATTFTVTSDDVIVRLFNPVTRADKR